MSRPKVKRLAIRIDMTPMVDIAFLLLIFFMATTQFKPPESVPITLPSSHSSLKLPESDVLIISVTKDNQVNLSLGSPGLDADLGFMTRTDEGTLKPVSYLPQELGDNIKRARMRNLKLRLILKADKAAEYGYVEDVMNVLQKNNLNRFNMVTELETN
ncbi:MAG: biopolymer transporter ExbD [Candidatus Zixiibacteriota bacterium]|nr:MAG: biopolymer transporter ExbD [candidate division Zixibacteria bacterium]